MKKVSHVKIFIIILLISVCTYLILIPKKSLSYDSIPTNSSSLQFLPNASTYPLNSAIYTHLNSSATRIKVYNSAIALNNGDSANACVYFISEVLRQTGFNLPKSICNTAELISLIKKGGLKIINDYKQLKPGDICFTTDSNLNASGIPSHTYVFMGWVKKGKYDFAYICDNQAKDYNNKIYHVRNISINYKIGDKSKDPFSFFVRK